MQSPIVEMSPGGGDLELSVDASSAASVASMRSPRSLLSPLPSASSVSSSGGATGVGSLLDQHLTSVSESAKQRIQEEAIPEEDTVLESDGLVMDEFEDSIEIEQELWGGGESPSRREGAVLSDIGDLSMSESSFGGTSLDFGADDNFDTDDLAAELGLADGQERSRDKKKDKKKKDRDKGKDSKKHKDGKRSKSKERSSKDGTSKGKSSRSKSKESQSTVARGAAFDPLAAFAKQQEDDQKEVDADPPSQKGTLACMSLLRAVALLMGHACVQSRLNQSLM